MDGGDEAVVLIFGRSILEGVGLTDVRKAGPHVLQERLTAATGRPVRVEIRRLNPDGRDASGYVSRILLDLDPDVAVIGVGAYDFGVGRVVNRLSELFGIRIARAASRVEAKTRAFQKTSRPGFLNRTARRIMTRFIGQAPMRTKAEAEFTLESVFRALSRNEGLDVIAYDTSGGGSRLINERNPAYGQLVSSFVADWEARARHRHFTWLGAAHLPDEAWATDGVHFTERGHEIWVEHLAPTILDLLQRPPDR
ncbi:MAG TPA: hypothetical protein VFK32_07760 [Tepidiformaceae bacterium]|nr:hypothetical protein [Tepidiformaceae bacterium]